MAELLFTEGNTRLQVAVDSWEAAVELGGELLVAQGCAENSYIDGMIEFTKKNNEDVVLAEGMAVPHARFEKGAFRRGVSMITLKAPLYFADSHDLVQVVICFSAMNVQESLHILSMVIDFIETKLIDRLAGAQTVDEVNRLIQSMGI